MVRRRSVPDRTFLFGLILLVLSCLTSGCSTHIPIPPGEIPPAKPVLPSEEQYGHEILSKLSEEYPLDMSHPRAVEVFDVVERLSKAANANGDPWHVYIFRDPNFKNAAATQGNHVFIWTGLLDSTKSEGELAAILGHEMSHVLARHTDPDPNEQVKKMLIGAGALAAGIAVAAVSQGSIGSNLGDLTSNVTQSVGEGLFLNPYSQERELEADQVGLFLMADAGFDPQAAIEFWKRAETDPAFDTSLSFLSTHPPAADRLAQLEKYLPDAKRRFRGELPKGKAINPPPGAPAQGPGPQGGSAPQGVNQSAQAGYSASSGQPGQSPPPPAPVGRDPRNGSPHERGRVEPPPTVGAPVEPLPPGDTFAVDPQHPPRSVPEAPPLSGSSSANNSFAISAQWTVAADKVQLRTSPSRSAKAIGEFRAGAVVTGRPVDDGWFEVEQPDHGFIPYSYVRPAR